jgi:hypothetical protein
MKDQLARLFPPDISQSFDNTKRLSDYISVLARMVFIGPLSLLGIYWLTHIEPELSLTYICLVVVTLYFVALSIAIFASFSWLTAGYLELILFGGARTSWVAFVVTVSASLLLIGALAVVLYEIAANSSIVKDVLGSISAVKL